MIRIMEATDEDRERVVSMVERLLAGAMRIATF